MIFHCDALDWIRRKRPWQQFFRYVNRLEVGSAYYSRLLDNEEIAERQEERAAEREAEGLPAAPGRPPLLGFTTLHHTLYDLIDTTRAVAAADPSQVKPWPRPETASERIRRRTKAQSHYDVITKAMGRDVPSFAPRG